MSVHIVSSIETQDFGAMTLRVGDLNGDGCDEIFVGYALIDHDGRVLFDHHAQYGIDRVYPQFHSDANAIMQLADGQWRLLFGNLGARCLTPDGKTLWQREMNEAQHVLVGRFSEETALQAVVIKRHVLHIA